MPSQAALVATTRGARLLRGSNVSVNLSRKLGQEMTSAPSVCTAFSRRARLAMAELLVITFLTIPECGGCLFSLTTTARKAAGLIRSAGVLGRHYSTWASRRSQV